MERIWIYQANRKLDADESKYLLEKMDKFTEQWTAHGRQLAAQALLRYNQFLIIRVNEALVRATGCSIDKSTEALKRIQEELGIDFFDRMSIAYREGEEIKTVSRNEFEKLIQNGAINRETIVFNNMVENGKDLELSWEVSFKDSWHAQVFPL